MNDAQIIQIIQAAILAGTPLVFASVGELLTERSGVLNLGVNGMMLVGAISGFWATFATSSLTLGVLAGLVAGAVFSMIHAFTSVTLRVNQIVSGLALAIFGRGLANFIGRTTSPPLVGEPSKAQFKQLFGSELSDLPIVGPLIFGHDAMVYVSWIVVAAASYYLFHTRAGLSLRSVGENPAGADSAGLNVNRIRYVHVLIGGGLSGVAGAYIPLALNPSWADDATNLGWIAIALVIIAAWRPWRALLAGYLFGGMVKLGFTLQVLGLEVPAQFLSMIPFVATIIILIATTSGKRARLFGAPAALAVPYDRESR